MHADAIPAGLSIRVLERDKAILVVRFSLSRCSKLAPAELEVARWAAAGLSNLAIARQRGTSERTVANQMARIFRKLGVGSRTELAAVPEVCL